MTEISLHDYLEQIEGLLEDSRLGEAAAHCRHILEQQPRHIDTYRLLGKALLERGEHEGAGDIFQRVLSADPEDFISHVGLAIIHKDTDLLGQALWHMERAFEMDPYNAVIQQELRELYGRRDGAAPERLTLTRAALARLYVKGDLYQQAVAELRTLLAETVPTDGDGVPSDARIDLQALLAEALWRDDQRVDAVEVCLDILDRLPNCIKANAILADVWLFTGRIDEAQAYLQRLYELTLPVEATLDPDDPAGHAFRADGAMPLPADVVVERLGDEIAAGLEDLAEAPGWVQELDFEDETWTEEEDTPDWLQTIEGAEALAEDSAPAGDEPALADGVGQVETDEDDLDWLRDLAAPPDDDIAAPEVGEEEAVVADLDDDWFAEMAGEEEAGPFPAGEPDVIDTGPLSEEDWELAGEEMSWDDWLDSATDEDEEDATPAPAGDGGEIPDWLEEEAKQVEQLEAAKEAGDEDALPDWLLDETEATEDEFTRPDLIVEEEAQAEGALPAPADAAEQIPVESEVEEMQMGAADEQGKHDVPEEDAQDVPEDLDDALAWLEELAAAQGAPREELPSLQDEDTEAAADEDLPDWLKSDKDLSPAMNALDWLEEDEEQATEEQATAEADDEEEAIPDWLREDVSGPAGELSPAAGSEPESEEDLSWLDQIAAGEGAAIEEPPTFSWPEDEDEDAADVEDTAAGEPVAGETEEDLDWLTEASSTFSWSEDEEAAAAEDAATGEPVAEETEEDLDWLDELAVADEPGVAEPDSAEPEPFTSDLEEMPEDLDEAMAWLEQMAIGQDVSPEALDALEEEEIGDEVPEDLDEAMAWLERLAAQQGAPLDELPSVRGQAEETAEPVPEAETPLEPEAADQFPAGEETVEEEALDWLDEFAAEEVADLTAADVSAEAEAEEAPDYADEALDWLDELAAEADADEVTPVVFDEVEEDVSIEPDEAHSWLEELAEEAGTPPNEAPLPAAPVEEQETPAVPQDVLAARAEAEAQLAREAEGAEEADVAEPDMADMVDMDIPDDPDEAMAWLEQLAARQGASLDELPTVGEAAEDVDMPAWLVEEVAAAEAEEAAEAEAEPEMDAEPAPEPEAAPEPQMEPEQAPAGEMDLTLDDLPDDPDEAMAWLEQLAARQGASLDELPTVGEVAEDVDMPAWLAEEVAAAEAEEAAAKAEPEPESDVEAAPEPEPEPEPEMPEAAPVSETVSEDVLEEVPETPVEEPAEEPAGEEFAFDLEDEDVGEALPDWLSMEVGGEAAPPALDWLDEEAAVGDWLAAEDEVTREEPAPQPEMRRDVPEETVEAEPVQPEPEPEPAPVPVAPAPPAGMDQEQLVAAREAMNQGEYDAAMSAYQSLLEEGEGLNVLIADLEQAVKAEFRERPLVRRQLGDAYMRNGQLQKALETYQKALEML